jgi:hypothetical protein
MNTDIRQCSFCGRRARVAVSGGDATSMRTGARICRDCAELAVDEIRVAEYESHAGDEQRSSGAEQTRGDQLRALFRDSWDPEKYRALQQLLENPLKENEKRALMWAIDALSSLLGRDAQQTWHRAL